MGRQTARRKSTSSEIGSGPAAALEAEAKGRAAKQKADPPAKPETDAEKIARLEARVAELEGHLATVANANQGAAAEFEYYGRELTRLAARAHSKVARPAPPTAG